MRLLVRSRRAATDRQLLQSTSYLARPFEYGSVSKRGRCRITTFDTAQICSFTPRTAAAEPFSGASKVRALVPEFLDSQIEPMPSFDAQPLSSRNTAEEGPPTLIIIMAAMVTSLCYLLGAYIVIAENLHRVGRCSRSGSNLRRDRASS